MVNIQMLFKVVVACISCVGSLGALPLGETTIQGNGAFSLSGDTLQIEVSGKAIIHWNLFDIAPHETVLFNQTQGNLPILNRVVSGSASQILGNLQSNCPVYLLNPQGVFIGASACIDTAGFLASTADLSNEAFWQGSEMLFAHLGFGSIINLGKISASHGDVFLISRAINNQGSIEALNGDAVLTTHEIMLNPVTKECVFIRMDRAIEEEKGIENSGTIQALTVELRAQSPYEKAIQHFGSIEAFTILEKNGRIYLCSENGGTVVNGSLTAFSGEVRILGQEIILQEHARIDVSGDAGGTALIGGDFQGRNPEIMNAANLTVLPGACIYANSNLAGNGGKVIYWSDGVTNVAGRTEVKGGPERGDGGFVEVSGARVLTYSGISDRSAPKGNAGTILFDPESTMTISAAGDSNVSFSGGIFTPTNTTSNISNLNNGFISL